MPSRTHRFKAKVKQNGPNPYVEIPPDISAAFAKYAEKGRIRVSGTLETAEIRGNLVPRGKGHWLFLHVGMRAAAGVKVGDEVKLALRGDHWDQITPPNDAKRALKNAGVLDAFNKLGVNRRHELMRWVEIAETQTAREKRLQDVIRQVLGTGESTKIGQAAKRDRALWTCPKCGNVFANKNQWHSCKKYTLDQTFVNSEPFVRALFDRLREMVESVGPVRIQAYRDRVAFIVRVRFMGASPKKRWLDVGFWLPRRIEHNRFRKVETITPTDHVHYLRITDDGELDGQVMAWIRECYAVGEQKHLT